jgi:hypothetical protein
LPLQSVIAELARERVPEEAPPLMVARIRSLNHHPSCAVRPALIEVVSSGRSCEAAMHLAWLNHIDDFEAYGVT